MIKRLFIKFPLYTLFYLNCSLLVIPILYWIITGKDYGNLLYKIEGL